MIIHFNVEYQDRRSFDAALADIRKTVRLYKRENGDSVVYAWIRSGDLEIEVDNDDPLLVNWRDCGFRVCRADTNPTLLCAALLLLRHHYGSAITVYAARSDWFEWAEASKLCKSATGLRLDVYECRRSSDGAPSAGCCPKSKNH